MFEIRNLYLISLRIIVFTGLETKHVDEICFELGISTDTLVDIVNNSTMRKWFICYHDPLTVTVDRFGNTPISSKTRWYLEVTEEGQLEYERALLKREHINLT